MRRWRPCCDPGATELEIAKESGSVGGQVGPMLGPMIEEVLLLQLRHSIETEAVNATERAEGQHLPGARLVTIAFADLVGFTRLGEAVPPEELEQLSQRLADLTREVAVRAGALHQDDRRRGDAGQLRAGAAARCGDASSSTLPSATTTSRACASVSPPGWRSAGRGTGSAVRSTSPAG